MRHRSYRIAGRCRTITIAACCLLLLAAEASDAQRIGFPRGPRNGAFRLSLDAAGNALGDDLTKAGSNYVYRPYASLGVSYVVHPAFETGLFVGMGNMSSHYGELEAGNSSVWVGLDEELRLPLAGGAVNPFLLLRAGGLLFWPTLTQYGVTTEGSRQFAWTYGLGAGVEFIIARRFGFRVFYLSTLTSTDLLDNMIAGGQNDGFSMLALGFTFYLPSRHSMY